MSARGKQSAFLAAYRETGNIRLACEAAGVGRSSHYRWLRQDPSYAEACRAAAEDAADRLEAEARRRAVEGVEKPVGWHQGEPGGYVREYSDTLLIFLLKGIRPEKYRDRMEVRGTLANLDFSRLSDEQLDRIADGEHPLAVLGEGVRALMAGNDANAGVVVDWDAEGDDKSDDPSGGV